MNPAESSNRLLDSKPSAKIAKPPKPLQRADSSPTVPFPSPSSSPQDPPTQLHRADSHPTVPNLPLSASPREEGSRTPSSPSSPDSLSSFISRTRSLSIASSSSSSTGVSPEISPLVPPKPIFIQLIEATLPLSSHEESSRDKTIPLEGFLYTYRWFDKTTILLEHLRAFLTNAAYADKHKDNIMRFAIRLCSTPRLVPLNDEERALLKAMAEAASQSQFENLMFKGKRLQLLLTQAVSPSVAQANVKTDGAWYKAFKEGIVSGTRPADYKDKLKEMAKEVHNRNLSLLKSICHDEFSRDCRKNDFQGSPHIKQAVAFFNKLSAFAQKEIKESTDKTRIRMHEFLIDLCWELFELKDFNCFMALLLGLGNIDKFFSDFHTKQQNRYKQMLPCLDPLNNFGPLRKMMEEAEKTNSTTFIPYLAFILKDITVIEDTFNFSAPLVNIFGVNTLAAPLLRFFNSINTCSLLPCQPTGILETL